MSIYLVVPLLAAIGLLQTTVVCRFKVWGVFPDLPLLVVAGWGLIRGRREGLVWGFVAGIIVDLFSGAPFGAATLSLMAVGWLSGLGTVTVFRNWLLPLLTILVATLVYDVLFLLIVRISGTQVEWLDSLFRIVIPSALLNALCTPFIVGGMRLAYQRLRREEVVL